MLPTSRAEGDTVLNEVINPTRLQNPSDVRRVTWASYNQCRNLVLPENVCFNAFYLEPFLLSELGLITPAGEACGPVPRDAARRRCGCSPWQGQQHL